MPHLYCIAVISVAVGFALFAAYCATLFFSTRKKDLDELYELRQYKENRESSKQ